MNIQLEPKVIAEQEKRYFVCPSCDRVINMSWDDQQHQVCYPSKCSECGQELKWKKRLVDLLDEED